MTPDLPIASSTIVDEVTGKEWDLMMFNDHADLTDPETGAMVDAVGRVGGIPGELFARGGRLFFKPEPKAQARIDVYGTRMPCCRGQCPCHKPAPHQPCPECQARVRAFIEAVFPP